VLKAWHIASVCCYKLCLCCYKLCRTLTYSIAVLLQAMVVAGAIPVTPLKLFVSHVTVKCCSVALDFSVDVANTSAKFGFVRCFSVCKSCMSFYTERSTTSVGRLLLVRSFFLFDAPSRFYYGSCPSVCPSVRLRTHKLKGGEKPKSV